MPDLEQVVEQISSMEEREEQLEQKFSEIDSIEKDQQVLETQLQYDIKEKPVSGTFAGIDGGIVKKRYSRGDVVAVRAVAALFSFQKSSIEASNYIPGRSVDPEYHFIRPGDNNDFQKKCEELRIGAESDVAVKSAKEADIVFMDGSIVPGYEPSASSFERLIESSEKGRLVGVVEDSYGLKLSKLLSEKTGIDVGEVRDTVLMDSILSKAERSFVRRYSKGPAEHPVIGNLDQEKASEILTFYVKLSEKDLPLRIDYYGDVKDADRIASVLMAIKSSDTYTVPSPVLEADRRAKISKEKMLQFDRRFKPKEKRRDRRTF